ncbi:MAG: hypothetical protein ABSA64_06225 [Sedimentisphaerales bacterium]|jgi:4-hydroxybenzoate polyprenyltransferase
MNNPETNPFSLFFKAIAKNYSGLIAVMLVGTTCFLWLKNTTVPEELKNITLMVVSFLFGRGTSWKKTKTNTEDKALAE